MKYFLVLILSTWLAGCATPAPERQTSEQGMDIVTQAYMHIHGEYVEQIHTTELFEAALENIALELPHYRERAMAAITRYRPSGDSPVSFYRSIQDSFTYILAGEDDKIQRDRLSESAVLGMMDILDSHSRYIEPGEAKDYVKFQRYPSIGINFTRMDSSGEAYVYEVFADSPADKSGLRAGDIITQIDGQRVNRMKPGTIADKLRGPEGTKVSLMVRRKQFRGEIRIDTYCSKQGYKVYETLYDFPTPNIIYIRYRSFYHQTSENFIKLLDLFDKRYGRKSLKGIIIDVRASPGGTLQDVAGLMDLFVRDKTLVYVEGRVEMVNMRFSADKQQILQGMPFVVLVDHETAGAGELLAQFLHEQMGAVTLGRETQHYGGIRYIVPLSNGGLITYTVGKMFLEDGWDINEKGVQLDLCSRPRTQGGCIGGVDLPIGKTDPTLQWAITILNKKQDKKAAR